MKGGAELWIAATLLVALGVTEGTKPKGNSEPSDLEGAEASYSYTFANDLRSIYSNPFTHSITPLQAAYQSTYSSARTSFGQNNNCTIHQEIRCGDLYPRGCQDQRYRSHDGSCNNLQNPTWGMANTRYARVLPANYGDGVDSPTVSVTGASLPLSREVSYTMFPYVDINDPIWTLAAMQWGQIITHDMALIDGTTQSKPHTTQCCTSTGQLVHPALLDDQCYPIIIPYDDPVYSRANTRCLNFVRSTTDLDRGCSAPNKPAEQLTVVTHFLDLSLVYGSSDQLAANLRAGVGGRMRVDIRSNREWPPQAVNKSQLCEIASPSETCYQTGDVRGNQNTQLTVLQIILLREHNRVADTLARLNPHWTDETTYQEARRIVIAEHQQISYYEWLPIFIGTQNTHDNHILYNTQDFVNDYNPNVNPSVLNEHSTAAFRYFHTLIAGYLNLVTENRSSIGSLRLSDHFNRPAVIEVSNNMADLTRGLSYQAEKDSDQYFDKEITEYLFRNGRPLGSDLRATDIQRNRDHGLASYNDVREFCGMTRAKTFSDFTDNISAANVQKLSQLYASPDDVELTVGGSLETHVSDTLTGPTFLCIVTRQFYRTRVGDRYWYERSDTQASFTLEQLHEIRKASISRLLCDNGDNIQNMQSSAFQRVSSSNPITSCDNISSVDLSLWKDFAPELARQQSIPFPYFKK